MITMMKFLIWNYENHKWDSRKQLRKYEEAQNFRDKQVDELTFFWNPPKSSSPLIGIQRYLKPRRNTGKPFKFFQIIHFFLLLII